MKKFDYMKSFKVLLAAALVIIVAGAFVLGFLNFNKDVKYTKHYEIVVQANDIGKAEETVKDTAEKVFRQEGVNPVYSESTNDNFEFTLVYLFRNDVSASVVESLQKEMDSAFQQTTVEVKVEKNYAEGYFAFTEMWWALLAAGGRVLLCGDPLQMGRGVRVFDNFRVRRGVDPCAYGACPRTRYARLSCSAGGGVRLYHGDGAVFHEYRQGR